MTRGLTPHDGVKAHVGMSRRRDRNARSICPLHHPALAPRGSGPNTPARTIGQRYRQQHIDIEPWLKKRWLAFSAQNESYSDACGGFDDVLAGSGRQSPFQADAGQLPDARSARKVRQS